MAETNLILLTETCRTCAEKIDTEICKNIFEIDFETELAPINFMKKLINSNFEVKENDGLPQQICENCFNNFSVIYEFSLICEQSQIKLKEEFQHKTHPIHNKNQQIKEFKVEILDIENDADDDPNIYEHENNYLNIKHEINDNDDNDDEDDENDNLEIDIENNQDEFKTEYVIDDDDAVSQNYEMIFGNHNIDQEIVANSPPPKQQISMNYVKTKEETERIENSHQLTIAKRQFHQDDDSDRWSSDNEIDKISKELDKFTCQYCKRNFDSYLTLNVHQKPRNCKKFPKFNFYLCEMCGIVLRPSSIEAHNNQHQGVKPYRCTICGVGYTRGANYTMHMRVQHKEIKSNCIYCSQKFKSFYLLEIHKSAMHPNEKEEEANQIPTENPKSITHQSTRYKCPFCPKQFRCLSLLSMHCKMHSKPDNCKHSCKLCGAIFKRADHLKLHTMAVHEKNKPHFCDHCPRRFAMAADRNSHMIAAHTGKRYICKYCNKEFSGRNSVQQHERKHEGLKRFHCGFCDAKFLTTSSLQSHERLDHAVNDDMKKQLAIQIYKELVPINENDTECVIKENSQYKLNA